MTKVFFILSALLIIASTFFAYVNGREFVKVRAEVTTTNVQVQGALKDVNAVVAEIGTVNSEVAKLTDELSTEQEKTKAQKLKIAQADNDTKRAQGDLDDNNKKLADLRVRLDKLPQGMKPETMVEEINGMKKATAELQAEAEMKKKEAEAEEGKMVEARRALDEVVRKIEDRKKAFDRNSLNARVVAVNSDWGFVVVDAGQSRGISEATKLLVIRGSQTVGKLSIVAVQGERTVANIIPDTLAAGMSIAPGDRVILEKLYQ